MPDKTLGRLCELGSLTRDYARYSRSAGGLASVLGGVSCLFAYFLGGLLPSTPVLRVVLTALPVAWLLARQVMAHRYYQRFGHVEEQEGAAERRTHRFCIGVAFVVALLLTVSALSHGMHLSSGQVGYLALIWLLVLACWRWLRSPLDFIVGTFLFCQVALLCMGRGYPVVGSAAAAANPPLALLALLFPLMALLMIAHGVADHRRFLQLRDRLLQLRIDATSEA